MPSLSDASHMDTCAGKYCRAMLERTQMKRIPGRRGWWCPRCFAKTPPRDRPTISPPSRDTLVRCTEEGCAQLVYLDEAVKGSLIAPGLQGRFCPDSARRMGYWPPEEVLKLHQLLEAEGLFARSPLDLPSPPKGPQPLRINPVTKGPNPDQGELL